MPTRDDAAVCVRGCRALVTGGVGLIGSHIVDELVKAGAAEIVVLDNFVRGCQDKLVGARPWPRLDRGGDIFAIKRGRSAHVRHRRRVSSGGHPHHAVRREAALRRSRSWWTRRSTCSKRRCAQESGRWWRRQRVGHGAAEAFPTPEGHAGMATARSRARTVQRRPAQLQQRPNTALRSSTSTARMDVTGAH